MNKTNQDRVLAALLQSPVPLNQAELASTTKIRVSAVRDSIKSLLSSETIEMLKRGKYNFYRFTGSAACFPEEVDQASRIIDHLILAVPPKSITELSIDLGNTKESLQRTLNSLVKENKIKVNKDFKEPVYQIINKANHQNWLSPLGKV